MKKDQEERSPSHSRSEKKAARREGERLVRGGKKMRNRGETTTAEEEGKSILGGEMTVQEGKMKKHPATTRVAHGE